MQSLHRRFIIWAVVIGLLLLIPVVEMKISDQWNWTGSDFVFAAVLLYGSALTFELVSRRMKNQTYRLAVGFGVAAGLVLLWVNAAVGIITSEDGPVNLIYVAIIFFGFCAALISRFEARRMSRVLFGMATAQMLIPALVLTVYLHDFPGPRDTFKIFILHAFFALLFVVSGFLFQRAARES